MLSLVMIIISLMSASFLAGFWLGRKTRQTGGNGGHAIATGKGSSAVGGAGGRGK